MGGLSAAFRIDGAGVERRLLHRMSESARHRGAQEASWVEGPVGLAHRRAPASLPGEQPAMSDDGELHAIINGRLYNQEAVQADLRRAGSSLRSGSQLATIISAYRTWGSKCVERFDGDFAFVIHDVKRGALFCARDALGVKPLYYAFDGRQFLAASEPKQLLAAGISSQPCERRIAAYLSLVPSLAAGPRTFFDDIRLLEPGQWLEADSNGIRIGTYWQLDPEHEIEETTEEAMAERVRVIMEDAVKRRLPDSPPYACALSGGFDSSSIAGLMRRVLDGTGVQDPLETFSFEFRDEEADESELAEIVAREVRANHHPVYLDRENVFEVLPNLLRAGDEPTADMGLLMLWRKKQEAANNGVHVLLSGLGGDEIFFGKLHYFADLLRAGRLRELWREVHSFYPVDRSTGKATSRRKLISNYAISPLFPRRVKKFVRSVLLRDNPLGPWVHPGLARRTGLQELIRQDPPRVYRDFYRQDCYNVFRYELVSITLPIHDALNAAFALDTRFPLLDRRLVEYLFAAPREVKIREGHSRMLQRRAMAGILPGAVLEEHRKKNFHPVMERQQRVHFEREVTRVLDQRTKLSADYVDWPRVRNIFDDYTRNNAWYPLWYVVNLERWLQEIVYKRQSRSETDHA